MKTLQPVTQPLVTWRRLVRAVFLLSMGCMSLAYAADAPIVVTYFGNNAYLPEEMTWAEAQTDIEIVVVNLDDHRNLERELSEALPKNDLARATEIAQKRVAVVSQARWQALFSGPIKAKQWQVRRVPAVVFGEGKQVIYGVTDLKQAIQRWQSQEGRYAASHL